MINGNLKLFHLPRFGLLNNFSIFLDLGDAVHGKLVKVSFPQSLSGSDEVMLVVGTSAPDQKGSVVGH